MLITEATDPVVSSGFSLNSALSVNRRYGSESMFYFVLFAHRVFHISQSEVQQDCGADVITKPSKLWYKHSLIEYSSKQILKQTAYVTV